MIKQIKPILFSITTIALFAVAGCKKGTFDINSPNPNVPSTVPVQFSLSSAIKRISRPDVQRGYATGGFHTILDGLLVSER